MKVRMRDGSGTSDLRYVVEDVDRHGNVRVYFRRFGKKTRLRQAPGSDEFLAEYRVAYRVSVRSEKPNDPTVSLGWLIVQYYGSAEFRSLGDATRKQRRRILDQIRERHGDKPFALMRARHIRQLRDEKIATPDAANNRIKALRHLFKWATSPDVELLEANPARDIGKLKSNNPDGFHTWAADEVNRYEARHPVGTTPRLALALLLFTGVRRSDVVRLGPQMEKNGFVCFIEAKGRENAPKHRELPILPELRAVLDATPSGHLSYLVTVYGKPFTANGFGNRFRKWCDEVGLPHCSAHGLRKAGATIAATNSATERQLMAIYGWETSQQAVHYTKAVDRRRLAAEAMHLLVPRDRNAR